MEYGYTIIFLVGVIYTVVTFFLGGLLGLAHFDTHIDTHFDIHFDPHSVTPTFTISPLKPITIVSFITVFGGVGIMGTRLGISGIIVFILAVVTGLITSFVLYRFIVVPLYKAQNTSAVSRVKLIGIKATVISPIFENGFGTIAYVVNGSKYNGPAQHVSKRAVEQGEEVIVYDIKNNIFYVQPLNEKN